MRTSLETEAVAPPFRDGRGGTNALGNPLDSDRSLASFALILFCSTYVTPPSTHNPPPKVYRVIRPGSFFVLRHSCADDDPHASTRALQNVHPRSVHIGKGLPAHQPVCACCYPEPHKGNSWVTRAKQKSNASHSLIWIRVPFLACFLCTLITHLKYGLCNTCGLVLMPQQRKTCTKSDDLCIFCLGFKIYFH